VPRKPDPERYCETCGVRLERKRWSTGELEALANFMRRRFCGRKCQHIGHMNQSSTNRQTMHYRARKQCRDACERCGADSRLEVHHRDGDRTNNELLNLETLCGSCHRAHHGVGPMLAARRSRSAGSSGST